MFALEVNFADNTLGKEVVLVRRSQALIGGDEVCHVSLEDLAPLDFQILLTRDIGRKFHVEPIPINSPQLSLLSEKVNGTFDAEALIDLDNVMLRIVCLDYDLLCREDEAFDKAGIRVLKQACGGNLEKFPAVYVEGPGFRPYALSFCQATPLLIGRLKHCTLRIDAPEISGSHARLGYENSKFWIEDLGSTNGTYIGQQQISGKTFLESGSSIKLGRNYFVKCIANSASGEVFTTVPNIPNKTKKEESRYPALISSSSIARPARVTIRPGTTIRLGRDRSSDMWLGAPHISRMHSTIVMNEQNEVVFSDFSTNGTRYDQGMLKRGDSIILKNEPKVFDFGTGTRIAICFSEQQELSFLNDKGKKEAFSASTSKASTDVVRQNRDSGVSLPKKQKPMLTAFASKISERIGISGITLVLISSTFLILVLLVMWNGA